VTEGDGRPVVASDHELVMMNTLRECQYPFEIALQRSPDERPELRRTVRTADRARLALDQEYEQLRQQGISGDLVLIDHDHGHLILKRRHLRA
jgi:hypothetical protein